MPRTEKPKKRAIRYCGDCGYKLAADSDGTCPVCPRFQQLRIDFTVPRPSDLATRRAAFGQTDVSASLDEWPSVAEYRAILAERWGIGSAVESRGRVIRTPGLRQAHVPLPHRSAEGADEEIPAPPPAESSELDQPATPPTEAKVSKRKGRPRKDPPSVRARPSSVAEAHGAAPTVGSSGGPTAADVPSTNRSAALPGEPEAHGAVLVETEPVVGTRYVAHPTVKAASRRRIASRARAGARWPGLVPLVVVAACALIGALVPLLLMWP